MPHRQTPAIIIDCHDFMEADKIITFFTLSFGKLTGIAKGAKKSRKRFGINLDLFSHVNLLFYAKGLNPSLVRIESCDIIHYFDQISADTKKFVYGCYFLELIKNKKVVLIRNQEDFLCSPEIEQAVKDYKNVRYLELPGGHDDFMTNPQPYIDLILKEL